MSKTATSEMQVALETLYSKYQLLPVLREEFSELSKEYPVPEEKLFVEETLSQLCLHRQADPETLVGILSPKHGSPQKVADKLLLMVDLDYMDFDPESCKFILKYDISEDVKAILARYQYPLPMITKPDQVKHNTQTGYKTIKGLIILNGNQECLDKDVCLDHVNRANSVALCLDEKVINSPQGEYKKPKREPGESFLEYDKRAKQASTFYHKARTSMELIQQLSDKFHLTHKYDRRGRCYSSGYFINTQSNEYGKSVIQFANKELVK